MVIKSFRCRFLPCVEHLLTLLEVRISVQHLNIATFLTEPFKVIDSPKHPAAWLLVLTWQQLDAVWQRDCASKTKTKFPGNLSRRPKSVFAGTILTRKGQDGLPLLCSTVMMERHGPDPSSKPSSKVPLQETLT